MFETAPMCVGPACSSPCSRKLPRSFPVCMLGIPCCHALGPDYTPPAICKWGNVSHQARFWACLICPKHIVDFWNNLYRQRSTLGSHRSCGRRVSIEGKRMPVLYSSMPDSGSFIAGASCLETCGAQGIVHHTIRAL